MNSAQPNKFHSSYHGLFVCRSLWPRPKCWQLAFAGIMATCSHSDKLAVWNSEASVCKVKCGKVERQIRKPLARCFKAAQGGGGALLLPACVMLAIKVGPPTIERCLYVMTPQLKPDYPRPSDVTAPPPSTPTRSSRTIWRLLEDARSHEFNGQSGRLWPAPTPRSCHLARHRDDTVPTAWAGLDVWGRGFERKNWAESKGCW